MAARCTANVGVGSALPEVENESLLEKLGQAGKDWLRSLKVNEEVRSKRGSNSSCTRALRILPIDIAVADRWGLLTANAKANPISAIDALLAATAIQHDLTLVSRNVGDFAHVPVQVLNPWEPS